MYVKYYLNCNKKISHNYQVSQYLNPLSLQIMSRTKEFNCPSSQTSQNNTPSKHDSISLASDEIPSLGQRDIFYPVDSKNFVVL